MAIIKTIQEVKQLMPRLLSALSNNALLPNMDRACDKYLLPFTGVDLFNQVHEAYNNNTLTPQQTSLLTRMQLVVAANAFLDELAFTHASITDHGVRTATTANMPRVYGWEFKELKSALEQLALDALDTLLQHLVINRADFPTWTNSPEFKQFDQLLIKTAIEFNNIHSLVQPFRTFYAMKTLMVDVQETHIIPAIGQDMFDRLNGGVDLSDMEKLVKQQVKKAIAFLTIARACEHLAVRMDHNGFTVTATTGDAESDAAGKSNAPGAMITAKKDVATRDGNNYLAKAKNMLWLASKNPDASAAFTTAFTTSPVAKYIPPSDRESGNNRRKIFRF